MSPAYDIQADGPTRHGPRKRRKVTRSKLGCLTCRKRKKLCDMEHPSCGACVRLGKDCEWPDDSGSTPTEASQHRPAVFSTDSSTTVDDFTEIFGGIESMNHKPTPPNPSFFPMFANTLSLDSSFDRSGMGMPPMLLGDRPVYENEGHWDATSILDSLFNPNLDEATLQFWTSGCLNQEPAAPSAPIIPPHVPPLAPAPLEPGEAESGGSEDSLVQYHRSTLLPLISPDPPELSDWISPTSPVRIGLRNAIIAFSARHLANNGEMQHEVLSQKKEEQAREVLFAKVAEWELGVGAQWDEGDKWVLGAGILTLIRVKECRGDVWDYSSLHSALKAFSGALYSADVPLASKEFTLLENLLHHDIFSSFALLQPPIVTDSAMSNLAQSTRNSLTPLLGISFPLLDLIKRTIDVVRRRRSLNGKTWNDDEHIDMVQAADELQDELRDEKKRLDALTKEHPNLSPHRFLYEALRTACLLLIRGYILSHAPSAIDVGLLVRQNLSLLETMREQALPGMSTTHWVLFVTALNCVPSKNGKNERGRAMTLYQAMIDDISFQHLTRSKRLVEEVWRKNQEGEVLVDWVDILEQWGWEMYFV